MLSLQHPRDTQLSILTALRVESSITYIHTVGQPSPPSISRTFSSFQTDPVPMKPSLPSPLPQPLAPLLYSLSHECDPSGDLMSAIRHCPSFCDWLMTQPSVLQAHPRCSRCWTSLRPTEGALGCGGHRAGSTWRHCLNQVPSAS